MQQIPTTVYKSAVPGGCWIAARILFVVFGCTATAFLAFVTINQMLIGWLPSLVAAIFCIVYIVEIFYSETIIRKVLQNLRNRITDLKEVTGRLEKDTRILEKRNNELSDTNEKLTETEKSLAKRNNELSDINKKLTETEKSLTNDLAESQKTIANLKTCLADANVLHQRTAALLKHLAISGEKFADWEKVLANDVNRLTGVTDQLSTTTAIVSGLVLKLNDHNTSKPPTKSRSYGVSTTDKIHIYIDKKRPFDLF